MTPVIALLAGIIIGSIITLIAVKSGSTVATRAYLGAFPPEPMIHLPTPTNDTNSSPDQQQQETPVAMSERDLEQDIDPEGQANFDRMYIDDDGELSPNRWKEAGE